MALEHLLHLFGVYSPLKNNTIYVAVVLGITLSGCSRHDPDLTSGDPSLGQSLIYSYNCGSCHTIPGVPEAKGTVGPPLEGIGNRRYIAGSLVNTPENLITWTIRPQQVQPGTAMPNLGVTQEQAADIAAYLYTLR